MQVDEARAQAKRIGRPRVLKPAKYSDLARLIATFLEGGGTMVELAHRTEVPRSTLDRWYTEGEPKDFKTILNAYKQIRELIEQQRAGEQGHAAGGGTEPEVLR